MSNAERLIALQGERAECLRRFAEYPNNDDPTHKSVRKFLYDTLEPTIRELTDRVIQETWADGLLSLDLKDRLKVAGGTGDPLAIAVLRELELD